MYTHILNPRTGNFNPLKHNQAARLNGVINNIPQVNAVRLQQAQRLSEGLPLDSGLLGQLYHYSPLIFQDINKAHMVCIKMVCDLVKIQSLTKYTGFWPSVRSLGTGDCQALHDLIKSGRYQEGLQLLLSYTYIPRVSQEGHIGFMLPQDIGLNLTQLVKTTLYDNMKKYYTGFCSQIK